MTSRNTPSSESPSAGVRTLACVLAAAAGSVDAAGFLQFEEVFVSFMSGNSTSVGVAFAQGDFEDAASSALPIVLFVAGSCLGGVVAHFAKRRAFRVVTSLEVLLLAAAVLLPNRDDQWSAAFALTVLAMGVQNAALSRTAAGGVGVTYVTGTLAKLGRELAALLVERPRRARAWRFHVLLWASFALGGVLGGVAYTNFGFVALVAPIVVLLLLIVWSVVAPNFIEGEQTKSAP